MASSGMGVWISLQSSAAVRLFHATRYECLADVDVAPPVHKMLASKSNNHFSSDRTNLGTRCLTNLRSVALDWPLRLSHYNYIRNMFY